MTLCVAALGEDGASLFEYLSASTHVLARDGSKLVGHACWSTRWLQPTGGQPLRTAWVDAVVVDPFVQGRGIGTEVMLRVTGSILEYDLGGLGTERALFYERVGWEVWQGPTEGVLYDPNDSLLILRTPRTPALDLMAKITAG